MAENNVNNQVFFTDELFTKILGERGRMLSWQPLEVDSSSGILSNLNTDPNKPVGHFGFKIVYSPCEGPSQSLLVVVKSKVTSATVIGLVNALAQGCGPPLSIAYAKHKARHGLSRSDIRELNMYGTKDSRFTDIIPEIFYIYSDLSQDMYLLAMEFLGPDNVTHLNKIDTASDVWRQEDIEVALRDIARFHSMHLGKVESWLEVPWVESYSVQGMVELSELWLGFAENGRRQVPEIWTENRYRIALQIIKYIDRIWTIFESSPRTLIHNDFNPRNACIRISSQTSSEDTDEDKATAQSPTRRLCLFDWELVAVHVPQYDVAEFLSFTLPQDSEPTVRLEYLEFYRKELEKWSGIALDKNRFIEVFNLACCDLAINRLGAYTMIHTLQRLTYLPRILHSHMGYLEYLDATGQLTFGI